MENDGQCAIGRVRWEVRNHGRGQSSFCKWGVWISIRGLNEAHQRWMCMSDIPGQIYSGKQKTGELRWTESRQDKLGAKFVWMQIVREWQLNRDADCLYGFRVSLCKMWARLVKLLNFGSGLEEKGCAWGSSMLSRIFLLLRDQNSLLFLQLLNLLGDLDVWLTDYASYCYTFFAHFEDQK